MDRQPIYVIGHANPDTDSVASAVAYAELLRLQGGSDVVAARQGKLRPETDFVLERFGLPPPVLVRDAYLRVSDVMTSRANALPATASILQVVEALRDGDAPAVLLTNEREELTGVIALGDLGRLVFEGMGTPETDTIPVELSNVVAALQGTVLHEAKGRRLRDKVTVGAMSVESIRSRVERDALLVLGDREDAQRAAIEGGVAALIVTGGYPVSAEIIALARERNVTIISVQHHTFQTVRLLHMSIPASHLMNRAPQTCAPDDRVEDARALLATYPMLPVVDDAGRPAGVVSRSDLLKPVRRRFILVDHNERGQSLPGLEEAEVLAIVDHHRVADVATTSPIVFRAEPVGSTCTIIAGLYREARIEIPRPVAGAMLAAIVSDTVLFRSPTSTSRDRDVAAMLESRCGVSADELADAMFERSSDLANRSVRDLLEADFKEFAVGGRRFGIGSADVTNLTALDALVDELRRTMEAVRRERGFSSLLFLVVDVIHARSRIYVSGHERAAASALGLTLRDGWYVNVDRVVSRKKDVVPVLGAVAQEA